MLSNAEAMELNYETGWLGEGGGLQFYTKNKLKLEIFDDKKSL